MDDYFHSLPTITEAKDIVMQVKKASNEEVSN